MNSLTPDKRADIWDGRMVELIDLVVHLGYRMQGLADHFNCEKSALNSALKRRGIGLLVLRSDYVKGKDVYQWAA